VVRHGVVITIELTIMSMVAGILIGVLLAVMRLSKSGLITSVARVYIWFFRGTPVLAEPENERLRSLRSKVI